MTPLFVDPNIAKAKTLDPAFYTSSEYFEIARKLQIFFLWPFQNIQGTNKKQYPGFWPLQY